MTAQRGYSTGKAFQPADAYPQPLINHPKNAVKTQKSGFPEVSMLFVVKRGASRGLFDVDIGRSFSIIEAAIGLLETCFEVLCIEFSVE